MVFQRPARETIESLRAILQNLEDTPDNESGDLAYLRRLMLERIARTLDSWTNFVRAVETIGRHQCFQQIPARSGAFAYC
jgi:hypothetical protein